MVHRVQRFHMKFFFAACLRKFQMLTKIPRVRLHQGTMKGSKRWGTLSTCTLDPILTLLLKEFIDELLPFPVQFHNASLVEGCLPESHVHAIIQPEIKKPLIGSHSIKHYHPISNLTFLSKVIKKLEVWQLLRFGIMQPCAKATIQLQEGPFDLNFFWSSSLKSAMPWTLDTIHCSHSWMWAWRFTL